MAVESLIGKYVIFDSHREGFSGRALGKIVDELKTGYYRIKRIDNPNDKIDYNREIKIGMYNVQIISSDEFLARLEF